MMGKGKSTRAVGGVILPRYSASTVRDLPRYLRFPPRVSRGQRRASRRSRLRPTHNPGPPARHHLWPRELWGVAPAPDPEVPHTAPFSGSPLGASPHYTHFLFFRTFPSGTPTPSALALQACPSGVGRASGAGRVDLRTCGPWGRASTRRPGWGWREGVGRPVSGGGPGSSFEPPGPRRPRARAPGGRRPR